MESQIVEQPARDIPGDQRIQDAARESVEPARQIDELDLLRWQTTYKNAWWTRVFSLQQRATSSEPSAQTSKLKLKILKQMVNSRRLFICQHCLMPMIILFIVNVKQRL